MRLPYILRESTVTVLFEEGFIYLLRMLESPPSMAIVCPVIQLCSEDNIQEMAEAISSGSPILPSGCIANDAFREESFEVIRSDRGVRVKPGATQFTRMPLFAYVAAAERVKPSTPAFAAAIAS